MKIIDVKEKQWKELREIYEEAFPKTERKPFFVVKHSVKKGKARMLIAVDRGKLQGFVMVIPYQNTAMVDYLAVSSKARGQGTGSEMIQEVCRRFSDKKIVLLIEQINSAAKNNEQREKRRKFYLQNGFYSSGIFIEGYSGTMEILNYGGIVSPQEYINLQRYALGRLMFWFSRIKLEAA